MSNLVSIIVPVYNVEKYLRKCIDSILNQTYSNLEIILVNDGSNDNSSQICSEYLQKDTRIKLINKENGGLSSARNAGIEIAKGNYIGFIDSDDWIDADMIEKMVNLATEENADIIQCGIKTVLENGKIDRYIYNTDNIYYDNDRIMDAYFKEKISVTVCNKIYNMKLVKGIKMVEGKNHEDNMYSIEVFLNSNKVVTISDCFYNYLQRKNSITKIQFNEKKLDGIYAGKYVLRMCETHNDKYVNQARISLCLICYYLYQDLIMSKANEKYKYIKIIKDEFYNNFSYIKKSKEISCISVKNKFKIYSFAYIRVISLIIYKIHILFRSIKLYVR